MNVAIVTEIHVMVVIDKIFCVGGYMGKIEKIIDILKTPKEQISSVPVVPSNPYKKCWDTLKDKILAMYSDIDLEAITSSKEALNNEQVSQISKYRVVSDIVNSMHIIEKENLE